MAQQQRTRIKFLLMANDWSQALVELPLEAFNLIQSPASENSTKSVEIYSAKGPVFSTAIIAGSFDSYLADLRVNFSIDCDSALHCVERWNTNCYDFDSLSNFSGIFISVCLFSTKQVTRQQ